MAENEYEVMACWEGFEPEVFEVWPTRRKALRSAHLNNTCRESEHVWYMVRKALNTSAVEAAEATQDGEAQAASLPE